VGPLEYVHGVSRIWSLTRRYGFDALIVIAALESALAVGLAGHSAEAPQTTGWFAIPAVAALPLPLLGRRGFPFAAPAFVWLLASAISFVDGRLLVFNAASFAAGLAAAWLLGNLADALQARVGLAIATGGAVIVVYNDPSHAAGDLIFTAVLIAIAWLAGFALRERAEQAEVAEARARQAEREREAAARIAVAEERARIARELHDVVAHAMSVMVLQVGAVRHRLPGELTEDRDALSGVERAGRQALAEMRQLLSAMRRDDDEVDLAPQPSLASLDALLEQVRRAGLPVDMHVEGDPVALPAAVDLSAYRIIQEGLTNALKHARATRADVTVQYAPGAVELEVRDDGDGGTTASAGGHGLVGIRERVKIYGGDMTAEPAPGRGFVLRTRLPLESVAR
jgi:signal transduction histidine kinase